MSEGNQPAKRIKFAEVHSTDADLEKSIMSEEDSEEEELPGEGDYEEEDAHPAVPCVEGPRHFHALGRGTRRLQTGEPFSSRVSRLGKLLLLKHTTIENLQRA